MILHYSRCVQKIQKYFAFNLDLWRNEARFHFYALIFIARIQCGRLVHRDVCRHLCVGIKKKLYDPRLKIIVSFSLRWKRSEWKWRKMKMNEVKTEKKSIGTSGNHNFALKNIHFVHVQQSIVKENRMKWSRSWRNRSSFRWNFIGNRHLKHKLKPIFRVSTISFPFITGTLFSHIISMQTLYFKCKPQLIRDSRKKKNSSESKFSFNQKCIIGDK